MKDDRYRLERRGSRYVLEAEGQDVAGRIVLQGDFPDFHQDSDETVSSATLRLNADLSTFNEKELERIALCEKYRAESISIRSYQRAFEPVVALLGRSKDFIDRFTNVYGGLLDILPVELPPDSEPVLALSSSGRLAVEYERPLPLDPAMCNRCRKCVSACPEEAIDSSPAIRMDACSLCGECSAVCETGAIDLHRMERISKRADVAVVEPALSLQVPRDMKERFYCPDDLHELLARIGTFHVEEAVVHQVEHCAFVPRLGIGCKRCLSMCPEKALDSSEKGIVIDQTRCTECGRCVSACPTGAMSLERFTDRLFLRYFSMLDLAPGARVVLGSQEGLKEFWWKTAGKRYERTLFVEFPQPAGLGSVHLLYLLVMGFAEVIVVSDDVGIRKGPAGRQAGFVNQVMRGLFGCEPVILSGFADLGRLLERQPPEPALEARAEAQALVSSSHLDGRRRVLSGLLALLYRKGPSGGEQAVEVSTDLFASASCSSACSLCLACLNVCSQDALRCVEQDGLRLEFCTGLCINCGACQQACPEKALEFTEGLLLSDRLLDFRTLAEDEVVRCRRCGKVFGNRKSFERTMNILKGSGRYGEKELQVLALCEGCRAAAMLEEIVGE